LSAPKGDDKLATNLLFISRAYFSFRQARRPNLRCAVPNLTANPHKQTKQKLSTKPARVKPVPMSFIGGGQVDLLVMCNKLN